METKINEVGHPRQESYFALLPKSEIEALKSELKEIKILFLKSKKEEIQNQWLSKAEAKKQLHVCLKTLDNYLSKGILPYSRFAGKIYIKASDIQAHLERHYIKA